MPNRMARPGQLTCVDEGCGQAGTRAVEGRTTCTVCCGPLGRVPEAVPPRVASGTGRHAPAQRRPTPMPVPAAATGWSDRPLGFRVAVSIGATIAVMIFLYVVTNWDAINDNEFKAGHEVYRVGSVTGGRITAWMSIR